MDGSSVIRFIIEPRNISLNFTTDAGKAKDVMVKGSISQKQKERWEQDNAALFAAQLELRSEALKGKVNISLSRFCIKKEITSYGLIKTH